MKSHVELGDRVRDLISGLEGVAVARCMYLHGRDEIGIQPQANNETGVVPALFWAKVSQIKSMEEGKSALGFQRDKP